MEAIEEYKYDNTGAKSLTFVMLFGMLVGLGLRLWLSRFGWRELTVDNTTPRLKSPPPQAYLV